MSLYMHFGCPKIFRRIIN